MARSCPRCGTDDVSPRFDECALCTRITDVESLRIALLASGRQLGATHATELQAVARMHERALASGERKAALAYADCLYALLRAAMGR